MHDWLVIVLADVQTNKLRRIDSFLGGGKMCHK